jgi:hypothetical protein
MRRLVLGLSALLLASCSNGGSETPKAPTTEKVPDTVLRYGERATYPPGGLTPLRSRIRCQAEAADARPLAARVPSPGKTASIIADGELGYSVTLTIVTHTDGKVAAVCGT